MSDADPSPAAGDPRIGHAERQAAVEALKHHHVAGRIDAQEYEERSVKATSARSSAELGALFTDLPLPHAAPPGSAASPAAQTHATLTPGAPAPEVEPVVGPGRQSRGILNLPEPWATTVVSIAPIAAVILFFVTDSWLWFLVIPVVAVLVYGPEGREGTGPEVAERKRNRNRNRNEKN